MQSVRWISKLAVTELRLLYVTSVLKWYIKISLCDNPSLLRVNLRLS